MKYQIYKPNQKNTGCAMSFEIGKAKDGSPAWFINAIQQASWNDSSKTGSFKENAKNPQKSTVVKMNANEAGEMISSIKSRIPVVFFHKFNEDTTIISFSPWDKERKIKGRNGDEVHISPAFGLTISKNSSIIFKVALEAGETEVLAVLLDDMIKQDLFHSKEAYKQEQSAPQEKRSVSAASAPNVQKQEFEEEDDVPF